MPQKLNKTISQKDYLSVGIRLIYKLLDKERKQAGELFFNIANRPYFLDQELPRMRFDLNFSKIMLPSEMNLDDSKHDDINFLIECSQKNIQPTYFEKILEEESINISSNSNESLKSQLSKEFNYQILDFDKLKNKQKVFLLKTNHGFWEYSRYAFSSEMDTSKFFERNNLYLYQRRLKKSGLTGFLAFLVNKYLRSKRSDIFYCSGLNNGEKESNFDSLSPVNASAAAGILSFYSAINKINSDKYYNSISSIIYASIMKLINKDFKKNFQSDHKIPFIDSECIKRIILEGEFLEKRLIESEAIIFVGNSKLKKIRSNYKKPEFFYQIPDNTVNENFLAVAAGLIGFVDEIKKTYRNITILIEAAVAASIMGFLIAFIFEHKRLRITFIDLGRAMHFADYEFCEKNSFDSKYHLAAKKYFYFEG